jgi:ribosomal protein S18 acetylase RimI-like enzyme
MSLETIKVQLLKEINKTVVNDIISLVMQLSPKYLPVITQESLITIINNPSSYILIALNEQKHVIGMLAMVTMVVPSGGKTWIEDVIVDEEYQSIGVGTKLVEAAIKVAKENRITHINLSCKPDRRVANKLYQKVGFKINETNYYRYII